MIREVSNNECFQTHALVLTAIALFCTALQQSELNPGTTIRQGSLECCFPDLSAHFFTASTLSETSSFSMYHNREDLEGLSPP